MLTTLLGRGNITLDATNPVTLTVLFEQAAGNWVDISSDVVSGSIHRGKTRELDAFQAGTCTLRLRNETRNYDPNYSSSPYNGSILPMRRMAIYATVNNTIYALFVGFIDSWTQIFPGPHHAFVDVAMTDAFKILSVYQLRTSPFTYEVLKDSPTHWWRLGDASGSTTGQDSIGSDHLVTKTGNGIGFGATGLALNDPDTAGTLAVSTDGMQTALNSGGLYVTGAPITVECLFTPSSFSGTTATSFVFVQETSISTGYGISVDSSGIPHFVVATTNISTGVSVAGPSALTLGTTYHLAGTWDSTGTATLYVNGVAVATGSTPAVPFGVAPATTVIGQPTGTGFTTNGVVGTVDECLFYTTALSATRIAAHSTAALSAWSGDTIDIRAGRILDQLNWPGGSDRVLSSGTSVLQSATTSNQTAVDHLQGVADADFGKLFINAWGAVTVKGRKDGVDQTSQGTFTDARNGSTNLIQVATPEYTDQLIRNSVTIQRNGGVAYLVEDATSIGVYYLHSYSKTGMFHNSDATSQNAATYLVTQYKNPLQRVSRIVVKPREDSSNLFPQAVGRELTDWITITYTPQGVGSAFTQTTVIEGVQHDFTPKDWTTTWMLSPADTNTYWELGTANYGELGSHTRLFF